MSMNLVNLNLFMYRQKEESSDKRTIEYLKDEIREYKRQIKVLKRTIEELKKKWITSKKYY